MRALDRKLVRDLVNMKGQAFAIAVVVAAGMALFIGTAATGRSLALSEQRYYEDYRFAQVWSHLARAPETVIDRLSAIPGVAAVEGRLVAQGILDVPHVEEPVTGLFIAIPSRPGHLLNDLYVRRGRHVEAGGNEALVGEAFADRNGLNPGDDVHAVIAGQRITLHIVGVALSPEFIMQIPPGGLVPDDRRFGVFWLEHDRLADLLDLRHAVNDVAIRLSNQASEAKVIAAVDRVLEPYGGEGAVGRGSQPSHVMLEEHIAPIATLSVVVPAIFLAVALFLLNVVLSRLVATERTQIGMMKAFGYENRQIASHYLLLVLAIVASGILLSLPAGISLGRVMFTWFATFFRFPVLVFRVEPTMVLAGAFAVLLACTLGVLGTLRAIVTMPPTIAMAPPAPMYRPTVLDRVGAIARLWAPATRMMLRSVTRHPTRALLTTAGMSGAVAIVIVGSSFGPSMDRLTDVRFRAEQRQDLSVVLAHTRSLEQWTGIAQLPGVRLAEPYRAVVARLHVGGHVQDVTLMGLGSSSRLRRIVDARYRITSVPPEGMVVSAWLASRLDVRRGEPVAVEIREGRRRTVTTRVAGLADEPVGTYVYMNLHTLDRLLNEPNTFSGIDFLIDPAQDRDLFSVLKRAPQALGVELRQTAIANFEQMNGAIGFMRGILTLFAVIIAIGVVYNAARIAVAERAYELATLRVLGFTRREISTILLGEIGLLAAPAIPLGCALGYGLSLGVARALSSDLARFPAIVEPSTYIVAVAVFVAAALGSALLVRRRLDRLDLIAVLKARE